jgi:hypothetical protein
MEATYSYQTSTYPCITLLNPISFHLESHKLKAVSLLQYRSAFFFTAPSSQYARRLVSSNVNMALGRDDYYASCSVRLISQEKGIRLRQDCGPLDCTDTAYTLIHCIYSRSWALLEPPQIVQPLKNFPAFYGTRRFNTVFTRALHWSLSWAISIQSTPSHPSKILLILSTHLRLGLPSGISHSCYMNRPSHSFWRYHSNYIMYAAAWEYMAEFQPLQQQHIQVCCHTHLSHPTRGAGPTSTIIKVGYVI